MLTFRNYQRSGINADLLQRTDVILCYTVIHRGYSCAFVILNLRNVLYVLYFTCLHERTSYMYVIVHKEKCQDIIVGARRTCRYVLLC